MRSEERVLLTGKDASGQSLRVAFAWNNDRFAHAISLHSDRQDTPLLLSEEGKELEVWPPSPPLQQLSQQALPDGRVALLLLGMAGKSHWSLSVAVDPNDRELVFDAACRVNLPARWLGSSYRLCCAAHKHQANSVILRSSVGSGRILTELLDESPAELLMTESDLAIVRGPSDGPLPATYRWKYRIGLSE